MAKRGPKTRYNKQIPMIAELLARLGYTDKEAAKYIGVCEKTYNNWKHKYKELVQSIKKGKVNIINQIEHALYQSAIGYEHPEDKFFWDTKKSKVVVQPTTKHYPPNPTSIIFSLKNLAPKKWRDKQEHVVEVEKIIVNRIKPGKGENEDE